MMNPNIFRVIGLGMLAFAASCIVGCGSSGGNAAINTQQVSFSAPVSVAVSTNDNMLVCDSGLVHVLSRVGAVYEADFTLGTNGNGLNPTHFVNPTDAIEDHSGTIYVVDAGLPGVYVFKPNSSSYLLYTTFGVQGGGAGEFLAPKGIAVDNAGTLYISDTSNAVVELWKPSGSTYVYSSSIGAGTLRTPQEVAVNGLGELVVADSSAEVVDVFTISSGDLTATVGSAGTAAGQFSDPTGVAVDPFNDIYVADGTNDVVDEFTLSSGTYTYSHKIGANALALYAYTTPTWVAVDNTSDVYVVDSTKDQVTIFPAGS